MWNRRLLFIALFLSSPSFAQDLTQDTHRLLEFDSRVGGSIIVSHQEQETIRVESALGLRHSGSADLVAFTGLFATDFANALHRYGANVQTYGEGTQRVLVISGRSAVSVKHLLAASFGYDLVFADPFCIIKGGLTALIGLLGDVAHGIVDLGIDVTRIGAALLYCTLDTAFVVAGEVAGFAGCVIVKAVDGTVYLARFAAYQIVNVLHIGARGAVYVVHHAVVGAYRLVDGVLRGVRNLLDRLFYGLRNPFGRPCHRVYVY